MNPMNQLIRKSLQSTEVTAATEGVSPGGQRVARRRNPDGRVAW